MDHSGDNAQAGAESSQPTYSTGTIVEYDAKAGYGYIEADEADPQDDLLLVHQRSLRDRELTVCAGDRVRFKTNDVPRGTLAVDVQPELPSGTSGFDEDERASGVVIRTRYESGFAFIRLHDGRDAFFHVSYVSHEDPELPQGTAITCRVVPTHKGLQAHDIFVDRVGESRAGETETPPRRAQASIPETPVTSAGDDVSVAHCADEAAHALLANALLARSNREWARAEALYEQGLATSPMPQIVLSYAAMQKERRRRESAMRIYEKGIKLFPDNPKLREDAGVLAGSLGQHVKAIQLLTEALEVCRATGNRGEKGVLIALARTHYQRESFGDAARWFTEALNLFGRGSTRLTQDNVRMMGLARVRSQHYRGDLTVRALQSADFRIAHAELMATGTEGAYLIVDTQSTEFVESYGITGRFLVCSMFKARVTQADLARIDRTVVAFSVQGRIDEKVVLLVVSSLDDPLQRVLSRRIEQRSEGKPAIVPLSQSSLETAKNPQAAFRDTLNRWLYRRDLFAVNTPVSGRRFFGRSRALLQLREAIAEGTAAGVFGLRKVGKTSLLQETARRGQESGDIVLFTDLLRVPVDVPDCRWLYWKIATQMRAAVAPTRIPRVRWRLGGQFDDFLDLPVDFPVATAFDSDLTAVLRAIESAKISPRPRVVLLLDEIERLLPTTAGKPGLEGFVDFFSYVRGVSQESDNFVVVIAGANTAVTETAQFDSRDNPVFNFFTEIYLQLLEVHEVTTMLRDLGRGMGLRFSTGAVGEIHRLTGGHPFFTRQLCSFIAEKETIRPREITRMAVTKMTRPYLERAGSDFLEIMQRLGRDFPAEREICLKLAAAGGQLPMVDLRRGAEASIRHLLGYQIVRTRKGDVFLTMELLRMWLQETYVNDQSS